MIRLVYAFLLPLSLPLVAQNDSDPVEAPVPVVSWSFSPGDPSNKLGTPDAKAQVVESDLVSPEYPTFEAQNTSLRLNGGSAWRLQESDLLAAESLRFDNGDTLTIETWIKMDTNRKSRYMYIVGKGRNDNDDFTPENQNWALRLQGDKNHAYPSFLFRSAGPDSDYHRWNSSTGIPDDGDWHYLALTYTFGIPESITAYIDGTKISDGGWEMGGATTKPPVTDADDIVIGGGNGFSQSNFFPRIAR